MDARRPGSLPTRSRTAPDSELADKALAGETYTEPHYLRQAQRYLGHATRTLRAVGRPVTLAALAEVMDPPSGTARAPARRPPGRPARPRLPRRPEPRTSPRGPAAPARGDDRRGNRTDFLTVAVHNQDDPIPTLVVDEFSAVAPDGVARLFGRGRSAGMSLLLGTQGLADLHPPDHPTPADQILGNLRTLIAHRQVVPDSAEQIAAIAGAGGTWVHTQRTDHRLNGQGSNRDTGTTTPPRK
jgi:hypothetical protein